MRRNLLRHDAPVSLRRSNAGYHSCVVSLKILLFLGDLLEGWQNFCCHSRYFLTYHPSSPNIFLVRQEGGVKQTP
jgi:hypothetical protein